MRRYDEMEKAETIADTQHNVEKNALGTNAEQLIQKLYDEKQNYDDGDFLHELIRLTFQSGASDLHFQQEENKVLMRMRKDGILKQLLIFTSAEFKKYLLKLKFMTGAKMNIDYLPQDGRFDFTVDINGKKKKIDVRVSFMPGLRGEGIVMRFLDAEASIKTFTDIGFSADHIEVTVCSIISMILARKLLH
jgi:type IV pilus assembly protein PilB